jgi:hypothetical protein
MLVNAQRNLFVKELRRLKRWKNILFEFIKGSGRARLREEKRHRHVRCRKKGGRKHLTDAKLAGQGHQAQSYYLRFRFMKQRLQQKGPILRSSRQRF